MTSPLWQISVATSPEAEEPVTALLERLLGEPATMFTDAETGIATVSVYCRRPSLAIHHATQAIWSTLKRLHAYGGMTTPDHVTLRRLQRRTWAESWKQHFKPLEIGRALLLKPSWSRRQPRQGQALVVLDPGLSFGTGHHPTSRFCLKQLARCRRPGRPQSLLDLGSGSGLLAIAAAKLGYRPVDAIDFDPTAIRVARGNARRNGVLDAITLHSTDLRRLPLRGPRRFDVVCANLTADLLTNERDRIAGQLAAAGRLILAGVLRTEFSTVQTAYAALGFRLERSRAEREWRSGLFVRRRSVLESF